VVFEFALLQTSLGHQMLEYVMFHQYGWLLFLAGFFGVSWLANYWAQSSTSPGLQYAGLGLYVVAEAVLFCPMLLLASSETIGGQAILPTAGLLTLMLFGGMTFTVWVTGVDFSFLRTALVVCGLGAFGLAIASAIFGFSLGIVFTVAMIVLACGYILYDTSNVMHHYRIGQHVAASLALFASVALLFWYVVQLLMRFRDE
jgi:hypothetical protein